VISRDTIMILGGMISTLASNGGPNARTIAPYSLSDSHLPGRGPS